MNGISFGDWVRKERLRRGWTTRDLAKYAGLIGSTAWRAELGDRDPKAQTIQKIARAFKKHAAIIPDGVRFERPKPRRTKARKTNVLTMKRAK